MRGGGSPTLPLIAALAFQASGRAGEADADKGLGFVELDAQAKQLVGNAARERAGHGRGIIIPLFSNSGFMSFLRNLICSMRRLSVNNWIVIGMDNRTCPALMGSPGRGEQSECVFPYGEGGGVTAERVGPRGGASESGPRRSEVRRMSRLTRRAGEAAPGQAGQPG